MEPNKRKKNYFSSNGSNQKRLKKFNLEAGMTGFLCTCNFREKNCVRDAYKLLNEFADEIYGTNEKKETDNVQEEENTEETAVEKEDVSERIEKDDQDEDEDEDEDISTALNKEIKELKAEFSKPVAARRFQAVNTGVKNVIFVRSTLPSPLELVTRIVTELDKTKKQRTRFLLRLLPVEVVCKAYMYDIKQKATFLFEKYFAQEPKTFSIIFYRHSNNTIHRDVIIEDLAEIISEKNPGNKADLKNPELAVVVEVIRGVCLLSVLPNYYRYKKYNLVEICNTKENAQKTNVETSLESTKERDEKEDSKEDGQSEETNSAEKKADENEGAA